MCHTIWSELRNFTNMTLCDDCHYVILPTPGVPPATALQESRPGRYIIGDQLTHADVRVFCNLSGLQSGLFDGELTAHKQRLRSG